MLAECPMPPKQEGFHICVAGSQVAATIKCEMSRSIRFPGGRVSPAPPPSRGVFLSGPPLSSTKVASLDSEIAADLLVVKHMRLLSGLAHLLDCDRIEIAEKGFARPAHGRINS